MKSVGQNVPIFNKKPPYVAVLKYNHYLVCIISIRVNIYLTLLINKLSMKNSKKIAIFSLALATAFLTAGTAMAHGGFGRGEGPNSEKREEFVQNRIGKLAEVLGVSVEDIEQYRDNKVKLEDILGENGLTKEEFREKMMDQRKSKMIVHLQELLDSGEITQEQFDERMAMFESGDFLKVRNKAFKHGFRDGFMHGKRLEK